ncbi:hypothetical protein LCGC14_1949760, partial [marine sediment metagenome]
MSNEQRFFLRDPWVFDPKEQRSLRTDTHLGFDTRALHAGFHPLDDFEAFRSFVPPITPSMTFPYKTFGNTPNPVYGRTAAPINLVFRTACGGSTFRLKSAFKEDILMH